jgi:hypothetical protein
MQFSNEERLNLKKMIAQSKEFVDHTEDIRRLKHSGLLLDSLRDIEKLKRAEKTLRESNPEEFRVLCQNTAPLMYKLYTDLFNKLVNDELNLVILIKLIRVLEMVEQGQVDQTEGSAMVGQMLKEMYIDSALRAGEKRDAESAAAAVANGTASTPAPETGKPVSYVQWKAAAAAAAAATK